MSEIKIYPSKTRNCVMITYFTYLYLVWNTFIHWKIHQCLAFSAPTWKIESTTHTHTHARASTRAHSRMSKLRVCLNENVTSAISVATTYPRPPTSKPANQPRKAFHVLMKKKFQWTISCLFRHPRKAATSRWIARNDNVIIAERGEPSIRISDRFVLQKFAYKSIADLRIFALRPHLVHSTNRIYLIIYYECAFIASMFYCKFIFEPWILSKIAYSRIALSLHFHLSISFSLSPLLFFYFFSHN